MLYIPYSPSHPRSNHLRLCNPRARVVRVCARLRVPRLRVPRLRASRAQARRASRGCGSRGASVVRGRVTNSTASRGAEAGAEDGSERSGALGSNVVAFETVSEGQDGNSETVGVSTGADTKANTSGAAAHLSHRSGALVSDVVAFETASEGQDGNVERVGVSGGADTKANTAGAAAHLRLVIFVSLRTAASAVAPSAPMQLSSRLRARGRMGKGERVGVSMGADTKAHTLGAGRT
eukprot:scaffold54074_cov60-Phaeocystis_antarctica.AAC.1